MQATHFAPTIAPPVPGVLKVKRDNNVIFIYVIDIISFNVLSSFSEMDRYSIFCDIKVSKRPSIVASSLSTERSANSALNFSVFLIENDNG